MFKNEVIVEEKQGWVHWLQDQLQDPDLRDTESVKLLF